jgi:hypothetical protein
MPRGNPTKPLHFRADASLQRRLAFCAADRGVSISEYLRSISEDAARQYLKSAADGQSAVDSAEGGR